MVPIASLLLVIGGTFVWAVANVQIKLLTEVNGTVLTLDRTLEDTLPYLFTLLGIGDRTGSLEQMDPQIRRQRTLEAVKRVHGESIPAIEFYTGSIVDLPDSERRGELERLGDSVRLAAKLHMEIGLGGGLSFRSLPELLEACPAAGSVVVGRAAIGRTLLVGLDRTLRDLRALVA